MIFFRLTLLALAPALAVVGILPSSRPVGAQEAEPSHGSSPPITDQDAAEVLAKAFAQRFNQTTATETRIIRRYKDEEEEIHIQSAQKFIGDRMHSVVRFLGPEEYRGWRMLTIEHPERVDDHFIFMKSLNRIKRVRAEPSDPFFATDFSLEDMERRDASDYRITAVNESMFSDEPVLVIEATPTYESGYLRAEFVISRRDFAQLRTRYYKKNSEMPTKEILFPRASIENVDGIPVARHIIVKAGNRRTETHAHVEQILMNPDLPNALFSATALEVDRRIPGL